MASCVVSRLRRVTDPSGELDMKGLAEVYQARQQAVDLLRCRGGRRLIMGRPVGVICRLSVLMLLATGVLPALSEALASPELVPVADMRHIKKFVAVEVQTQGTAEKLGISGAELTDVTRVTLLNKVPGIALEGSSGPAPDAPERLNQLGFFTCEVWTVGDQYIAAYHVDCNAGSYTTQKTPGSLWNQAILGYGPKDEVSEAVRKGVRAMVELFAATFASARADGGAR